MKYATFDADGLPTGFYDPGIHGERIPDGAAQLSDDQWLECIRNPGQRRIVDYGDGSVDLEEYTPPHPDLSDYKDRAKGHVDQKAGEVRARFPSPGTFQAEEYMQTERAAQDYADGGYSGDVPDEVQCWADAASMSAQDACDDILDTAATCHEALRQIRRERLVGKAGIENAADHDAVDSAEAAAIGALDAITPASVAAS